MHGQWFNERVIQKKEEEEGGEGQVPIPRLGCVQPLKPKGMPHASKRSAERLMAHTRNSIFSSNGMSDIRNSCQHVDYPTVGQDSYGDELHCSL